MRNNKGFALVGVAITLALLPSIILISSKLVSTVHNASIFAKQSDSRTAMTIDRDYLIQNSSAGATHYTLPVPDSGNLLPAALPLNQSDVYGTQYLYCSWDLNSTTSPSVMDHGSLRPANEVVGRIISAGPNKAMETSCSDASPLGDDYAVNIFESDLDYANSALGGWKAPVGQNYVDLINPVDYVGIGTTSAPTHRLELIGGTTASEGIAIGATTLFQNASSGITLDAVGGVNISQGGLYISGVQFADASRNLTAGTILASGLINTTAGYQINGVTVIDSNRNVSANNVTTSGDLAVAGATTLTGALVANGGISTTTLTTSGNATIGGSLTSTGSISSGGGYLISGTTVIDASRNLIGINTLGQSLLPSATNTFDLGSSTSQFRNVYATNLYQNGNQIIDTSQLSGTTNAVAKFTSAHALGNSQIYDDGNNVAINSSPSPGYKLYIKGSTSDSSAYAMQLVNSSSATIAYFRNDLSAFFAGNTFVGSDLTVGGGINAASGRFTVAALTGNTAITGTLNVTGAATVSGNLTANSNIYWGTKSIWLDSWLNQALLTTSSPTFAGLTVNGNISTTGNITATGTITGSKVYNAVYN